MTTGLSSRTEGLPSSGAKGGICCCPGPADTILPSRTTTSWLSRGAPPVPSITRTFRITITDVSMATKARTPAPRVGRCAGAAAGTSDASRNKWARTLLDMPVILAHRERSRYICRSRATVARPLLLQSFRHVLVRRIGHLRDIHVDGQRVPAPFLDDVEHPLPHRRERMTHVLRIVVRGE